MTIQSIVQRGVSQGPAGSSSDIVIESFTPEPYSILFVTICGTHPYNGGYEISGHGKWTRVIEDGLSDAGFNQNLGILLSVWMCKVGQNPQSQQVTITRFYNSFAYARCFEVNGAWFGKPVIQFSRGITTASGVTPEGELFLGDPDYYWHGSGMNSSILTFSLLDNFGVDSSEYITTSHPINTGYKEMSLWFGLKTTNNHLQIPSIFLNRPTQAISRAVSCYIEMKDERFELIPAIVAHSLDSSGEVLHPNYGSSPFSAHFPYSLHIDNSEIPGFLSNIAYADIDRRPLMNSMVAIVDAYQMPFRHIVYSPDDALEGQPFKFRVEGILNVFERREDFSIKVMFGLTNSRSRAPDSDNKVLMAVQVTIDSDGFIREMVSIKTENGSPAISLLTPSDYDLRWLLDSVLSVNLLSSNPSSAKVAMFCIDNIQIATISSVAGVGAELKPFVFISATESPYWLSNPKLYINVLNLDGGMTQGAADLPPIQEVQGPIYQIATSYFENDSEYPDNPQGKHIRIFKTIESGSYTFDAIAIDRISMKRLQPSYPSASSVSPLCLKMLGLNQVVNHSSIQNCIFILGATVRNSETIQLKIAFQNGIPQTPELERHWYDEESLTWTVDSLGQMAISGGPILIPQDSFIYKIACDENGVLQFLINQGGSVVAITPENNAALIANSVDIFYSHFMASFYCEASFQPGDSPSSLSLVFESLGYDDESVYEGISTQDALKEKAWITIPSDQWICRRNPSILGIDALSSSSLPTVGVDIELLSNSDFLLINKYAVYVAVVVDNGNYTLEMLPQGTDGNLATLIVSGDGGGQPYSISLKNNASIDNYGPFGLGNLRIQLEHMPYNFSIAVEVLVDASYVPAP